MLVLHRATGGLVEVDDALLMRTEGKVDNDVERTVWEEYCIGGCNGQAHRTGVPDAVDHFCSQHVKRSVNMHLKMALFADGVAATL